MRLLAVELERDLVRRLTRWLAIVFVAASAAGMAIAFINIDEHDEADLLARQEVAVQDCAWSRSYASGPPATVIGPDGSVTVVGPGLDGGRPFEAGPPPEAVAECRESLEALLAGDAEAGNDIWYDDPRPSATDFWNPDANESSFFGAIQSLLLVGALATGASLLGAEWKAGTITTQLTWEPRRVRLFLTKLVAAAIVVAALAMILQVVFTTLMLGLLSVRGVTTDIDGAWWADLGRGMARTAFLCGVGATLGGSLAMLFRNTAGAVVVVFAYLAVAESLLRVWQPDWAPWFIGENVSVVLVGHGPEFQEWTREPLTAALTVVGYAALLAAVASAAFRTRDIAGSS